MEMGRARRAKLMRRIMNRCNVDGECWIWTGPTSGNGRGGGYGRFNFGGRTMAVHRAMYVIVFGPIPTNKHIDHKCRNRLCCNPSHLECVTPKENAKRRDKK